MYRAFRYYNHIIILNGLVFKQSPLARAGDFPGGEPARASIWDSRVRLFPFLLRGGLD